jgi:hypothetical protein
MYLVALGCCPAEASITAPQVPGYTASRWKTILTSVEAFSLLIDFMPGEERIHPENRILG